ncbi:hypothetical protein [uncultured Desulfosarcina sp.]|uniref:hypothetical protein n=1 Tax=uncultured Desulfosarcina sp. TaxID=218289 RepID=UPI0029C69B12|nr:hypothetical protein [uncultured Desulfosarcina sp.]
MQRFIVGLVLWFGICLAGSTFVWAKDGPSDRLRQPVSSGTARTIGHLESERLVECSGMDTSLTDPDLLWAVNDGGNGPFLFALGRDGRDRGCIKVAGAANRDWEDLAAFMWHGKPMLLIADFGDNRQIHATHTLVVLEEPRLSTENRDRPLLAKVAWKMDFRYPDGSHDAESVAVDQAAGEVLVLTKRDTPPLLFALPLEPPPPGRTVTARMVMAIDCIPEPTAEDRRHPYGHVRSQPTGLDISSDGSRIVVLTYKHAYLFHRRPGDGLRSALERQPVVIELPLPQHCPELKQREAICFSKDDRSLIITSEGKGARIVERIINPGD